MLWSKQCSMLVGKKECEKSRQCWGLMFCRTAKPRVSERITLSLHQHLCLVITCSAENMTCVFIHEEFYFKFLNWKLHGFLNMHLHVFCLKSFHVTHHLHVKMKFLSSHFESLDLFFHRNIPCETKYQSKLVFRNGKLSQKGPFH